MQLSESALGDKAAADRRVAALEAKVWILSTVYVSIFLLTHSRSFLGTPDLS